MYSGEKIKGALTDGKTYKCIGISFGEIQIIDDENSAFWYSATCPGISGSKGDWIVVEDFSGGILTKFVSGETTRSPEDELEEKDKVIGGVTIRIGGKHRDKTVSRQNFYINATPEIKKQQDCMFKNFAESMAKYIVDKARRDYNNDLIASLNPYKPDDKFEFTILNHNFIAVYKINKWEIYENCNGTNQLYKELKFKDYISLANVKLFVFHSIYDRI